MEFQTIFCFLPDDDALLLIFNIKVFAYKSKEIKDISFYDIHSVS